MGDTLRRTCLGTTRAGAQCAREPAEGSAYCDLHDPERARTRGRNGRAKQLEAARSERETQAAALRAATVEDLRAALEAAMRAAFAEGDWAVVVSAVRAANELLKTHDLARDLEALRELVCARLPGVREELTRRLDA